MGRKMGYAGKNAKQRGEARKRRRKRAERREATAALREARNREMLAADHPGWRKSSLPLSGW